MPEHGVRCRPSTGEVTAGMPSRLLGRRGREQTAGHRFVKQLLDVGPEGGGRGADRRHAFHYLVDA